MRIFNYFYLVIYRYNNKTYLVGDIAWEEHPTDEFTLANNQTTTFLQYYLHHYGVNPNDVDIGQSLLVVRPTSRDRRAGRTEDIKLLPQLCYVTGMPPRANEDKRLKSNIQSMTRVAPKQRVVELTKFVRKLTE